MIAIHACFNRFQVSHQIHARDLVSVVLHLCAFDECRKLLNQLWFPIGKLGHVELLIDPHGHARFHAGRSPVCFWLRSGVTGLLTLLSFLKTCCKQEASRAVSRMQVPTAAAHSLFSGVD